MSNIIVVEGIHDVSRIKEVYKDAYTIITDGSNVSKKLIEELKELSKTNKIIVFTDPDYSGERIRKIIEKEVPNISHAFLPKDSCISKNKKKVGIEHASLDDIKKALDGIYTPGKKGNLNISDLYELGLVGENGSAKLRNDVSLTLNIGKTNGKTFLNRINSFGITKKDLGDIICRLKKEN